MSSAVNLMMVVDVEGPVDAIRRKRVEMFVVLFVPSLADQVTGWSVCNFCLSKEAHRCQEISALVPVWAPQTLSGHGT